jgi:hypothetical protein
VYFPFSENFGATARAKLYPLLEKNRLEEVEKKPPEKPIPLRIAGINWS